tara:strand:+ start:493 stop:726 length:234 start_codon:yes stop_codon:yes gene_type:complete
VVKPVMAGGYMPLKAGDLVINRRTNKPGLIVKVSESHRLAYGDMNKRMLYQLLENGKTTWIHDIALAAEYRRVNVAD